jgi:hypothetical protein
MTLTETRPATKIEARWRGRTVTALLLPLGPAAVAALRFLLPYKTTDSATEIARHVAAHQSAESAVVWLGFLATLSLVPAVLGAARIARPAAPRLTAAALALLVPAYLAIGWLVCGDAAVLFAVRHGMSFEIAGKAYESLHPAMVVAGAVFVAGHVIGTVLLGIALWKGSAIPKAVSAAVVVSQPLHFVAAVVVGSHALDLVAWGLNAVGFAVIATVVLRMSDEEWASR